MKAILFLILPVLAWQVSANEMMGKVIAVTDGDTIKILDAQETQHKIRLAGIDAPERNQDFGEKSKRALSEKIFGNRVRVVISGRDKYGRIVGDIYLDDRHINLEMVADGLAWHYIQYSTSAELAQAEKYARENKRGLWSMNAVPPWTFRKSKTEAKK